jgi:hypothetical protein
VAIRPLVMASGSFYVRTKKSEVCGLALKTKTG